MTSSTHCTHSATRVQQGVQALAWSGARWGRTDTVVMTASCNFVITASASSQLLTVKWTKVACGLLAN